MFKQTILIVDDMPSNIRILGDLLKDRYRVIVTTKGMEVSEILNDNDVDMILLDIVMPDINGYELCKKIKTINVYREIPIIFISSKDSDKDELEGFSVGAVDFIRKPFYPEIVLARVHAHMELKRFRDLLADSAYLDGLTGIYNRRKFDEFYKEMFSLAVRKQQSLSVFLIDIDHFKKYNDSYGHLEGDRAIISVAKALEKVIKRDYDLVARYGGEEFVCVVYGLAVHHVETLATEFIETIRKLEIPHVTSQVAEYLTISLGVSWHESVVDSQFESLKEDADKMLYKSKETGRNRFFVDCH